jgi:hypothetical protein
MKRLALVLSVLGLLAFLLPACGGGGSGDGNGVVPSSDWDEMVWDQDNWA